jgi:serine/threonine protein kinase
MSNNSSENDYETENEYDTETDKTDTESISSDDNTIQTNNLELQGSILKHYNIIYELGRGAFSIVWLCFNINNKKFYAMKVQNPSEYDEGFNEINFVKKLPTKPNVFNNLIEYFIYNKNNMKYICSIWDLHCSNIDGLIRNGKYKNGFKLSIVNRIMKQLSSAVYILHNKFKVFHGDIKSDNILVKGINNKDKFITNKYLELYNKSSLVKEPENKENDRLNINMEITKNVLKEYNESNISKYDIDDNLIENINISLADFGTYCKADESYQGEFGTRYYMSPEIILSGSCSYPVDIWALGCTYYELLSGNLLFDPIKDSRYSRNYYHLCLINETCGDFPLNFLKKTMKYRLFFIKNKIINYNKQSTRLERKLKELNNISETDYIEIKKKIEKFLTIDPLQRIKINSIYMGFGGES